MVWCFDSSVRKMTIQVSLLEVISSPVIRSAGKMDGPQLSMTHNHIFLNGHVDGTQSDKNPKLMLQISSASAGIRCTFVHTPEITVLSVEPVASPEVGIVVCSLLSNSTLIPSQKKKSLPFGPLKQMFCLLPLPSAFESFIVLIPPLEEYIRHNAFFFHQGISFKVIFLLSRGAKWRREDVDSLISLSVPFDLFPHEFPMHKK